MDTDEMKVVASRTADLAGELVEEAWVDVWLWPELEDDDEGRPVGKDLEQAKLNLAVALQAAYEDWLEGENSDT